MEVRRIMGFNRCFGLKAALMATAWGGLQRSALADCSDVQ